MADEQITTVGDILATVVPHTQQQKNTPRVPTPSTLKETDEKVYTHSVLTLTSLPRSKPNEGGAESQLHQSLCRT
jgi:hypothetical protein